jgi:hypothetical protein
MSESLRNVILLILLIIKYIVGSKPLYIYSFIFTLDFSEEGKGHVSLLERPCYALKVI